MIRPNFLKQICAFSLLCTLICACTAVKVSQKSAQYTLTNPTAADLTFRNITACDNALFSKEELTKMLVENGIMPRKDEQKARYQIDLSITKCLYHWQHFNKIDRVTWGYILLPILPASIPLLTTGYANKTDMMVDMTCNIALFDSKTRKVFRESFEFYNEKVFDGYFLNKKRKEEVADYYRNEIFNELLKETARYIGEIDTMRHIPADYTSTNVVAAPSLVSVKVDSVVNTPAKRQKIIKYNPKMHDLEKCVVHAQKHNENYVFNIVDERGRCFDRSDFTMTASAKEIVIWKNSCRFHVNIWDYVLNNVATRGRIEIEHKETGEKKVLPYEITPFPDVLVAREDFPGAQKAYADKTFAVAPLNQKKFPNLYVMLDSASREFYVVKLPLTYAARGQKGRDGNSGGHGDANIWIANGEDGGNGYDGGNVRLIVPNDSIAALFTCDLNGGAGGTGGNAGFFIADNGTITEGNKGNDGKKGNDGTLTIIATPTVFDFFKNIKHLHFTPKMLEL